jgi:glutaconate CoA-transferase subunit B
LARNTGPHRVITQLGVYGFDEETKRLKLITLHPGATLEDIKENSGFEIIIPDEVETSYVPTEEDLRLLRQEIDPVGLVLGK